MSDVPPPPPNDGEPARPPTGGPPPPPPPGATPPPPPPPSAPGPAVPPPPPGPTVPPQTTPGVPYQVPPTGPPPPFGATTSPPRPRDQPGAGRLLAMAILSLFCCGFVLGPIAAIKANGMLKQMDSRPGVQWTNRGTVQAAMIIGIIGAVLSVLGVIYLGTAGR